MSPGSPCLGLRIAAVIVPAVIVLVVDVCGMSLGSAILSALRAAGEEDEDHAEEQQDHRC